MCQNIIVDISKHMNPLFLDPYFQYFKYSHASKHFVYLRDMFHVYSNKFEFPFLRLHINKTNKCCLFIHNVRVPGTAK